MQTTCNVPAMAIYNQDISESSSLQSKPLRIGTLHRKIVRAVSPLLLLAIAGCPQVHALSVCPLQDGHVASQTIAHAGLPGIDEATRCMSSAAQPEAAGKHPDASHPLIVIGFMGGRVSATNLIHKEALLAKELQQHNPLAVHASVFANHDGQNALKTILQLLDGNKDGHLSTAEKSAARIVIYGHSWGASETVTLARQLNDLSIPVLLTIQVDSVQKPSENDERIPPNVREAINFYQSEGLLHGRSFIEAMDPRETTILGNYESNYSKNPVSCAGYPWYARAFMKAHIEIENDPLVWNRIEALIQTKVP